MLANKVKTLVIILTTILLLACVTLAVLSHPAFGTFRHRSAERIHQSPNWHDGRFRNQEPTPQFTGDANAPKAMRRMLFDAQPSRKPTEPVPAVKTDLHALRTDSDWLVWFGHSSYLFCLGGKRYLVDPVLKPEFPSSLMLKPFKGTDIYRPDDLPDIDCLIITHEHWDHMNYATLRDIRERVGHVICPLGIADYLLYWGYDPAVITEMDWYERYPLAEGDSPNGDSLNGNSLNNDSSFVITCLPSRHFSNRLLGRGNQTLWASFMVENGGRKVYVGGDGGYDKRFREIREQFGTIDLAFLENGQYNDNWRYIHTTPEDLEKAVLDLQASKVFTVHHDKYALAMHPWSEPDSVAHAIADRYGVRLLDAPIGTVVAF